VHETGSDGGARLAVTSGLPVLAPGKPKALSTEASLEKKLEL